MWSFFFFNDTATTEIYTLSLHDALPILTLCPADAPTVVRLHPDDLAELPADALAELPDTVRVVGDLSVERAGAVAETGATRVDAQLGAAPERVRAVLEIGRASCRERE